MRTSATVPILLLGGLVGVTSVGCEEAGHDDSEEVVIGAHSSATPEGNVEGTPPSDAVDVPEEAVRQAGSSASEAAGAAIEAIADARCAREERCGNIGGDGEHVNAIDCRAKVRQDWSDDLNAYACPAGIEQDELAECLEALRNEDCDNPLDTLARVVGCRASDLCDAR